MTTQEQVKGVNGNRFNALEMAGAFGDLGTLVPFLLVYMGAFHIDPVGLLFSFGMVNVISGWYFKTPIPVQPMKAIGTIVATQSGQITAGQLWGAGFFTGVFWIIVSVSGLVKVVANWVKIPVVKGLLLGLGISFIWKGLSMMVDVPWIAIGGLGLTLVAQRRIRKVPAIIFLLGFGILSASIMKPALLTNLAQVRPTFSWPHFAPVPFTWRELATGILLLALPQIPLTVGNGVLALVEENNELFPQRSVSTKQIGFSTGMINLFSPFIGGVPMCHGAGGMAGHVRFGAKTGGAPMIIGVILLVIALFFGKSVHLFLQFIPQAILGVILAITGWELAAGACRHKQQPLEFKLMLVTAAVALWNSGAALLVGIGLNQVMASAFNTQASKKEC